MVLQLLKISGRSLDPIYQDGDFVLISKIPIFLRGIRPGDVVVFHHPHLGRLIKLVEHLEAGGQSVFVVGLNEDSVDSRAFGSVPGSMVQGKVIWHIPKSQTGQRKFPGA